MKRRTLLSVDYQIPGRSDDWLPFDSDRSLLDADVVLFRPSLGHYSHSQSYLGKPSLNDHDSASVSEHVRRWRHEITEALKAGKTVFIFLPSLEDVYVHLGEKQYSGTGRNQRVTRIVQPMRNYDSLPFDLGEIIPKGGTNIRIAADLKQLAPYWAKYSERSPYHVYFNGPTGTPILTATSPAAVVGMIIRSGKGVAVLLPPVDYDEEEFTGKNKKGEEVWNQRGIAFGNQLVSDLVEIDRALRAEEEITPAPEWATAPDYRLSSELDLEAELKVKDETIDRLRRERSELEAKIAAAGSLRDLLYESGKPLERAILKTLQLIGFKAKPFKEDGSEFDAVFESEEGRFLGEAEGKNDRAVNIDKLDQLERNIREDFARQDKGAYAKAVLFGNAYRFRDPSQRDDFFTAKCYAAAARGKVALVRTPDLFPIARYLDANQDVEFARRCRIAILAAEGTVVGFPEIPNLGKPKGPAPDEL